MSSSRSGLDSLILDSSNYRCLYRIPYHPKKPQVSRSSLDGLSLSICDASNLSPCCPSPKKILPVSSASRRCVNQHFRNFSAEPSQAKAFVPPLRTRQSSFLEDLPLLLVQYPKISRAESTSSISEPPVTPPNKIYAPSESSTPPNGRFAGENFSRVILRNWFIEVVQRSSLWLSNHTNSEVCLWECV